MGRFEFQLGDLVPRSSHQRLTKSAVIVDILVKMSMAVVHARTHMLGNENTMDAMERPVRVFSVVHP